MDLHGSPQRELGGRHAGFAVRDAKSCSRCKVVASRAAKPACPPTIFTGRPDRLLFYYFVSTRFQAEVFASRVAKPECRTTIFTGRPDSPGVFLHLGQPILHVGSRFCMSAKRIPHVVLLRIYSPSRSLRQGLGY